jgi:hypothetical protein
MSDPTRCVGCGIRLDPNRPRFRSIDGGESLCVWCGDAIVRRDAGLIFLSPPRERSVYVVRPVSAAAEPRNDPPPRVCDPERISPDDLDRRLRAAGITHGRRDR